MSTQNNWPAKVSEKVETHTCAVPNRFMICYTRETSAFFLTSTFATSFLLFWCSPALEKACTHPTLRSVDSTNKIHQSAVVSPSHVTWHAEKLTGALFCLLRSNRITNLFWSKTSASTSEVCSKTWQSRMTWNGDFSPIVAFSRNFWRHLQRRKKARLTSRFDEKTNKQLSSTKHQNGLRFKVCTFIYHLAAFSRTSFQASEGSKNLARAACGSPCRRRLLPPVSTSLARIFLPAGPGLASSWKFCV